jgi:hypothetical protein
MAFKQVWLNVGNVSGAEIRGGLAHVRFGSRVDGALARGFLTFLQHWSGAVTCPAC